MEVQWRHGEEKKKNLIKILQLQHKWVNDFYLKWLNVIVTGRICAQTQNQRDSYKKTSSVLYFTSIVAEKEALRRVGINFHVAYSHLQ